MAAANLPLILSASSLVIFFRVPISSSSLQNIEVKSRISYDLNFPLRTQVISKFQNNGTGSARRVWRRRKLTKKDSMAHNIVDRVPFLEEQVRKIKEGGKLLAMDIEKLLLSEDNRFDFVNEVAAEAIEYVESNRDEYGGTKKAILHVLSNRMNDAGFYRPEAYAESDPFKPGPHYMKNDLEEVSID